ncbi:uncharacterized protein LOC113146511, partial [Cyclospora cayetanensis]|uniref:Uncharacterized protein LOC113146511 n=1 Tax=Cyclospora cayetanensis TaxID=88456 RepID=A0A6P6RQK9_9EIME
MAAMKNTHTLEDELRLLTEGLDRQRQQHHPQLEDQLQPNSQLHPSLHEDKLQEAEELHHEEQRPQRDVHQQHQEQQEQQGDGLGALGELERRLRSLGLFAGQQLRAIQQQHQHQQHQHQQHQEDGNPVSGALMPHRAEETLEVYGTARIPQQPQHQEDARLMLPNQNTFRQKPELQQEQQRQQQHWTREERVLQHYLQQQQQSQDEEQESVQEQYLQQQQQYLRQQQQRVPPSALRESLAAGGQGNFLQPHNRKPERFMQQQRQSQHVVQNGVAMEGCALNPDAAEFVPSCLLQRQLQQNRGSNAGAKGADAAAEAAAAVAAKSSFEPHRRSSMDAAWEEFVLLNEECNGIRNGVGNSSSQYAACGCGTLFKVQWHDNACTVFRLAINQAYVDIDIKLICTEAFASVLLVAAAVLPSESRWVAVAVKGGEAPSAPNILFVAACNEIGEAPTVAADRAAASSGTATVASLGEGNSSGSITTSISDLSDGSAVAAVATATTTANAAAPATTATAAKAASMRDAPVNAAAKKRLEDTAFSGSGSSKVHPHGCRLIAVEGVDAKGGTFCKATYFFHVGEFPTPGDAAAASRALALFRASRGHSAFFSALHYEVHEHVSARAASLLALAEKGLWERRQVRWTSPSEQQQLQQQRLQQQEHQQQRL